MPPHVSSRVKPHKDYGKLVFSRIMLGLPSHAAASLYIMELSSEDTFCLNVMLATGVQAVRIDTSSMTVYGLTEQGAASVKLHPTCRHDQYLKGVRQALAEHALDSPEGYPVYLRRWTRMGQLRDDNLARLLLTGEEEAIVAVVHAPGLTDEIARRAWWAMPTLENARRMLEKEQVAHGTMGRVLADFLVEHLPFEENPAAIMDTVRWLLHYDLVDEAAQITLWNRGREHGAYYLGFLEIRPNRLPKQLTPRTDFAQHSALLAPLTETGNPFALQLMRLLSAPGQSFLAGCEEALQRPGTHEIVSPLLNTIGHYFADLKEYLVPAESIANLLIEGAQLATGKPDTPPALLALLNTAPHLREDIGAMLILARTHADLALPILRRTTAVNALLCTKLQPVFDPLAQQIQVLRRAK